SLLLSNTHALATAWKANTFYAVGTLASYNGIDYTCIQAHTSQVGWEPPNVPALWAVASTGAATATRTPNTATGPTATRTRTPTTATGPTATRTRTPTTG